MNTCFHRGSSAAMLTLFQRDGSIDTERMALYARHLLASGLNGVLLFGTTGEGPSLPVGDRARALRDLVSAGVPSERIIVGTASASIKEVIDLTAEAGRSGCAGALVLPPFYFRDATEKGLRFFLWTLIEQTMDVGTPIFLYHFPDMSGLTYTHDLIEATISRYPGRIVGIKDSSGDHANTLELIRRFPSLEIYTGDDDRLRSTLEAGGAGSMTATAAILPILVKSTLDLCMGSVEDSGQESLLNRFWLNVLLAGKVTEGMKALLAHYTRDASWNASALPLLPLDEREIRALVNKVHALQDGRLIAEIAGFSKIAGAPAAA